MKILLVEPAYKVKIPSLGLMKLSAWHKARKDRVTYVKGNEGIGIDGNVDRIYITSIFTYDYRKVQDACRFYRFNFPRAEIWLGGIAATLSLHPEAEFTFNDLGIDRIHNGLLESEIEDIVPDYSLHPKLKKTILLSHRGCVRRCEFCCTRVHEPRFMPKRNIERYIIREFPKIECWDNNALANPNFDELVDILEGFGKVVDFNQSLDIRLLTEKKARQLKRLRLYPLRFSFDDIKYKENFLKGVEICKSAGLRQETRVDVLYNFQDSPDDFYERMHLILDAGWCPYPMTYKPIFKPDKEWISPLWTRDEMRRWRLFCRSQLGRQGDFFNPRCYIYFKNKRVKMPEVFKRRLFDTPAKDMQKQYRLRLLNKDDQLSLW